MNIDVREIEHFFYGLVTFLVNIEVRGLLWKNG